VARSKLKRCDRQWFVADIAVNQNYAVLSPRRGCHRVVVVLAEEIEETVTPEPHVTLRANKGDHLILCGPSID